MKNLFKLFLLLSFRICFGQDMPNTKIFETICDSIYPNKGYKIIRQYFPEGIDTISDHNTLFQFFGTAGSIKRMIYQDTISCQFSNIEFRDFNNDGVKDILIQNISDVRSNRTNYLYLVDSIHDRLRKIKGFEEIKNPRYKPEYNLIDNYVMSGRIWTSFYKIEGDSIKDFDIVIYDDQTDNGAYERDYKKSIKLILSKEKTTR